LTVKDFVADLKSDVMIYSYGDEDSNFVVELTYTYNVGSYDLGNDFHSITVLSSEVLARAEKNKEVWNLTTDETTGKFKTCW